MPFETLIREYGDDFTVFVETEDLDFIRNAKTSNAACYWGCGNVFGDTGYVLVCDQKNFNRKVLVRYVCKVEVFGVLDSL